MMCLGLKEINSQSLMNRDLKPSNILFNREGELKIADFGQCRVIDPSFTYTLDVGTKYYSIILQ